MIKLFSTHHGKQARPG